MALWTPTLLGATVIRWHDAQDTAGITFASGLATAWRDKSAVNDDLAEPTNPPNYSSAVQLNGFNILDCGPCTRSITVDGRRMVWSSTISTAKSLFAVVGTGLDSLNEGGGFLFGDTGNYPFHRGGGFAVEGKNHADSILNPSYGDPALISGGNVRRNGTSVPPTSTGFTAESTFNIWSFMSGGAAVAGFSNINYDRGFNRGGGDWAEILICDTILSSSDYEKVEGYMAWRWGLQASLPVGHPYKTAAPTDGSSTTFTSLTPTSGTTAGGTSVTLTGVGFTGATDVKFDTTSATSIVVVNDTTITCNSPAHAAGVVDVEVFTPGGNPTLAASYTYTAPPSATFTSLTPITGNISGGTAVTLTGTVFTGATDVKFDGTSATSIVVVSATTITCVTPAHAAATVDVQVFTPAGNPTLAASYTYTTTIGSRVTQAPVLVLDSSPEPARVTQAPVLVLSSSPQHVRVTQAPVLVLYEEKQPNRVTQAPLLVMYTPKPVPLPSPVVPEMPFYESWGWLTVVNPAHQGQEQRSRLRQTPRIKLQLSAVILNEDDRRNIYNMLMRYLKTTFLYPLFQYNTEITAAASTGDSKIFANTAFTDVRDGETVALFDPFLEQVHYLDISTVDSDGVNLVDPLTFDVPTYWQICPAISFRISPNVGLNMRAIDGSLSLTMESVKPRVFQRPGAAPTLTTIDGILIVPERPLANNQIPENFDFGVTWFDNNTSIPDNLNAWSNPRVVSKVIYNFERRTGIDYWRAVCDLMKGRQGRALFPTFRDDLPLRAGIALNATKFTTFNVDFFVWYLDLNYGYIMLDTANGFKYRRVAGVEPHYNSEGNPDYLTITLASSIGGTVGDNVINAISYMNLFRLDDDNVKLTHSDLETEIELSIKAVDK